MELHLTLDDPAQQALLFGAGDRNLRLIRSVLGVRVTARNSTIRLRGEARSVNRAAQALRTWQRHLREGRELSEELLLETLAPEGLESPDEPSDVIEVYQSGRVQPRTAGQRAYVEAVRQHDLVFCVGPAGTGKTYLAVALALSMMKRGRIKRIVLVRPAVEAGEKLGFLPGDMRAKVNPYLRPLFDAMMDMMAYEQMRRFLDSDLIEVIPLAFMRGRTLNRAAVILDEAQNTTVNQMLMFLTRLGHDSKMIVTGDDSQIDLERGQRSGLVDAVRRLGGVPGVAVVRLTDRDIVRHPLVQRVVNAYGNSRGVCRERDGGRHARQAEVPEAQPGGDESGGDRG